VTATGPLDGELIRAEVERLGISRLCHLTPMRNFLQIASGGGLRSVAELTAGGAVFDQQDLARHDDRLEHISCTIEYPNVWYLGNRRRDATPLQRNFPGWVCLLLDPKYLWAEGTEFAPRNAASSGGALLRPGYDAFMGLYAERVTGAGGKNRGRDAKPRACPTDDQAEVMVHNRVPLADASTIVLPDAAQASSCASAMRLLGVPLDDFEFLLAPDLFDARLSPRLRRGELPVETPWTPSALDAGG
jgi:hypothetical protein